MIFVLAETPRVSRGQITPHGEHIFSAGKYALMAPDQGSAALGAIKTSAESNDQAGLGEQALSLSL